MSEPDLLAEIAAEAERIRSDGTLPPGFEDEIAATFAALAADPAALEREARAAGSSPVERLRGGLDRRARQLVGPPIRSLQRKSFEKMVAVRDASAVRRLAAREQAGPLLARMGALTRRALGAAGRAPVAPLPPALSHDEAGRLVDGGLEEFILDSLAGIPAGPLLVLEGEQGFIGRRLATRFTLSPAGQGGGLFGPLRRCSAGSLAGIVLSGREAGGFEARLLARLVASRLRSGGSAVVVSDEPSWRARTDPVSADLVATGPINSGTWVYLLSAAGLEGARVRQSEDRSCYAVAARRPL